MPRRTHVIYSPVAAMADEIGYPIVALCGHVFKRLTPPTGSKPCRKCGKLWKQRFGKESLPEAYAPLPDIPTQE